MPSAIEAGVDLDKAIGDIEDMETDLKVQFLQRVVHAVDEATRETAEAFRDQVQEEIKKSEIDSDSGGELMNSWVVRPKGQYKYEVRSTADHAVYLEVGTSEHKIRGNPLVFEPRPGTEDEYPDAVIRDDGLVQITEVDHPGNEEYGYFQDAYNKKSWATTLNNKIRAKINPIIEEFERG